VKRLLFYRFIVSVALLFALGGCREVVIGNRSQQHVTISNFSAPAQTRLPYRTDYPSFLKLRVSGTVDKPVFLAVDQVDGKMLYRALRDTLQAGTYNDWTAKQDYYGLGEAQLTVTGTPGTTGKLTVTWYTQ